VGRHPAGADDPVLRRHRTTPDLLFDDMPAAEQELILNDPTIAAWHASRTT
jgi:hypothetical protein